MFKFVLLLSGVTTRYPLTVIDNVTTLLSCVSQCYFSTECSSIFYSKESQACILEKYILQNNAKVIDEETTNYYAFTTGACPNGYVFARSVKMCLKWMVTPTSFETAMVSCLPNGAHILYLKNKDIHYQIKQLLQYGRLIWIGLRKDGDDVYRWYDNTVATYLPWQRREPNGNESNFYENGQETINYTNRTSSEYVCQYDLNLSKKFIC